ncbi:MAG: hypothetical protein ACWGHO_03690 [Candidatus Moraniibacteriota bacterium]
MREIITFLRKKGRKFVLAYLVCAGIYVVFDCVYMPWLAYEFGGWLFIPLYPSILLANFVGLYLYDWLGEDVLFMEFGSNWIKEEGGKLEFIKKYLRKSRRIIFIILSIWPSPIAGYLFFRKEKTKLNAFKNIAFGSIFCTAVWGGLISLAWFAIISMINIF